MQAISRLGGRLALTIGIFVCVAVGGAMATTVDFEGLVTGQTVNGQAGWTLEDDLFLAPQAT